MVRRISGGSISCWRWSACTSTHQGEVIHVNPDFQPAPYDTGQPYGGFDDPGTHPARSDLTYLGLDPTAPHPWAP